MTIRHADTNAYNGDSEEGIGEDNLVLDDQFFVVRTAGIVTKAAAAGAISGVNYTIETFAADNEAVAKTDAKYAPTSLKRKYQIDIVGGAVTIANEDAVFDITADAQNVDGTTSATGVQLKLVEFLSADLGVFTIV